MKQGRILGGSEVDGRGTISLARPEPATSTPGTVPFSSMSATEDEANIDPYALLGLTPASTEKDIKTAYRKKSLTCHPDRVRSAPSDLDPTLRS